MILKIHLGSLKIHKQITEIDATIKKKEIYFVKKKKKEKLGGLKAL